MENIKNKFNEDGPRRISDEAFLKYMGMEKRPSLWRMAEAWMDEAYSDEMRIYICVIC